MTSRKASTTVWNYDLWMPVTFNFRFYDLDTTYRLELDVIDADPLVDVGEFEYCEVSEASNPIAAPKDTPSSNMRRIAIDYLRRNKVSKYIPQPSEEEEITNEGTYEEYRAQAEAEQNTPKHISHIIENAPEDSILGLVRSIKENADAITRLDGPDDKKYEWPDEPDHDCYHMEEVH